MMSPQQQQDFRQKQPMKPQSYPTSPWTETFYASMASYLSFPKNTDPPTASSLLLPTFTHQPIVPTLAPIVPALAPIVPALQPIASSLLFPKNADLRTASALLNPVFTSPPIDTPLLPILTALLLTEPAHLLPASSVRCTQKTFRQQILLTHCCHPPPLPMQKKLKNTYYDRHHRTRNHP